MISIFALLSLLTTITSSLFGTIVFYMKKEDQDNRVYFTLAIMYAYWAFTEFMFRQADLASTAEFWAKLSFIWPFCVALGLHFALTFTKNKILKKPLTYALLYFPAMILSGIDLTTNLLFGPPELNFWGYARTLPNTNWIKTMSIFWVCIVDILALLVCVMHYLKIKEKAEQTQTRIVIVGLSISIVLALMAQVIFPLIGIIVPELVNVFTMLVTVSMGIAIWKFGLFRLDPALVASNIIATIPDPLIVTNNHGKILTINKALIDFSGYKENEIIGTQIGSSNKSNFEKNTGLIKIFQERNVKDYEMRIQVKSGEEKWVLFSSSIIMDSKGRKIGFVIVFQDITERKSMESKLLKAERFASIGELAGMVGHDLRNPLMSIRTATFVLNKKYSGEIGIDGNKMLTNINKAIDYSDKIVNDLLDYSREIKLELIDSTPRSLVNSALALIEVPQTIQIRNNAEATPKFRVDIAKIERVFVNLIKNAIDAMPQKGVLIINSIESEETVEITFKDNGIGMNEDTLSRIWQPLFTTKPKGMGFGLSICKRIVEAHGGKIFVKSKIGEGTEFSLVFPNKSTRDEVILVLPNNQEGIIVK